MGKWFSFLVAVALSPDAFAFDPSWDGNHPEAKSEAWTFMGHLREVGGEGGLGYILYYTRNDQDRLGQMNFRSFARTTTRAGVGVAFETSTHYQARYRNSYLRARRGKLDLAFRAGEVHDEVLAVPLAPADDAILADILANYPGLRIAKGFRPKKMRLRAMDDDGSVLDLTYYSIWPATSPPGGRMRFLGQADTYTFSEPMLLSVGTWKGKRVVGLSFLDRQWAPLFFGTYATDGLDDLLKYQKPLNYAHGWSAFHALNQRTGEWSFFHVWNQFDRRADVGDRLTDDSLLIVTTGGGPSRRLTPNDYEWRPSGFTLNRGREVVLDYTMGDPGYFASRAQIHSDALGLDVELRATPTLQALDQPIPFFEGFASGEGTWAGDPIRVEGRLESSRLLFRLADLREMLRLLKTQAAEYQQVRLQASLAFQIARKERGDDQNWLRDPLAILANLLGEFDLKLRVFGGVLTGQRSRIDPADPDVTIYP